MELTRVDGSQVLRGPAVPAASAPPVDRMLPAVVRALEIELGRPPGQVTVVSSAKRSYSSVWELQGGSGRFFLKWLPMRAERELELTRRCRDIMAGMRFIRTPSVACCPTPDTFLVEKLPGVSLQMACTRPPLWGLGRWVQDRRRLLGHVGGWLEAFHACDVIRQPAPLAGVKAYVLEREASFHAIDRELVDRLLAALDTTMAATTVRVHGDFTPHNILVSGETVAAIDLAGITEFERETPCFDASAMTVGLEESWRARTRNHLRYYAAPVREMVAGFLQASGVDANEPAFAVCYAVRHFTRICTLLRQTGRRPSAGNWHVRRLRLALEQPQAIGALAGPGREG